jgi:peptidoglycan/LPS O-acetylase OafA/YrhL
MLAKAPDVKYNPKKNSSYRPDIDGLRALAILSVIIYHAFPDSLPGGFSGVDIFFVISGYLIFSIILRGLQTDSFSFAKFYAHRVKRIFPALSIVVLSTYLIGWVVLLPDEFSLLGKHIFAGMSFYENFLLRSESGYFDISSEFKPLMHLWSLAIEEQFYLLFPLIAWIAWRTRTSLILALLALTTISFSLNITGIEKNIVKTFFMPQTRVWELLSGAILAFFILRKNSTSHSPSQRNPTTLQQTFSLTKHIDVLKNTSSLLGLFLIFFNFIFLRETYLFPGWWALISVFGSTLIIFAGPSAWANRTLLSAKPMIFIGAISYPLYLWHWPILTFSKILQPHAPSILSGAICIITSFALSWLTYQFLEKPIRFGSATWIKTASLCIVASFLGAAGYVTYKKDGINTRAIVEKNPMTKPTLLTQSFEIRGCGLNDEETKEFSFCSTDSRGNAKFALIGDSKAAALLPGIFSHENPNGYWKIIGGNGRLGPTVPVISSAGIYQPYQTLAHLTLKAIANDSKLEVVAIATSTRALFQLDNDYSIEKLPASENKNAALEGLDTMVSEIIKTGKKVVLVIDNPTLPDPKKCVPRVTSLHVLDLMLGLNKQTPCSISYDKQMELSAAYRDVIYSIESRHRGSVRVFDTLDILCDAATRICGSVIDGRLVYGFTDHISVYSSIRVAEKLIPIIENFSKETLISKNPL